MHEKNRLGEFNTFKVTESMKTNEDGYFKKY